MSGKEDLKMKIMFASDIHGSYDAAKKIKNAYEAERADKLVLLGDLLYHGPRNPFPAEYNPQKVFELLNTVKNELLCVRGNCDSEVDQMVLEFPIRADYALLECDSITMFLTHGHLFDENNTPPVKDGDVIISGHTHIPLAHKKDGIVFLNPGSAALPKENYEKSYMIYENRKFIIKTFDGIKLFEYAV